MVRSESKRSPKLAFQLVSVNFSYTLLRRRPRGGRGTKMKDPPKRIVAGWRVGNLL